MPKHRADVHNYVLANLHPWVGDGLGEQDRACANHGVRRDVRGWMNQGPRGSAAPDKFLKPSFAGAAVAYGDDKLERHRPLKCLSARHRGSKDRLGNRIGKADRRGYTCFFQGRDDTRGMPTGPINQEGFHPKTIVDSSARPRNAERTHLRFGPSPVGIHSAFWRWRAAGATVET